ncbi:MAG: leucine-rich repeat domain-containing protein [Roseburia sp.]|nr:leucine-rich repeat domain-containing protein [Roseburia sp.]
MKRKILTVILSMVAIVTCAFALTACGTKHQHNYTIKIVDPTCIEQGYTLHTCACGDNYTDTYISPLGHDEILHNGKAATCLVKGWQDYVTCSRCDYSTYQEINLSDHDYGVWKQMKAPSCSDKGIERRDCLKCDNYETRDIATLPHTEVVDKAIPATCSATGLTEGKHCSNCNTVIVAQTIINRIAHNYGEWQKTKEPSCSKTGTERRDCLHCDNYEIRDIATLPHTEVVDKAISATCSATGLTEGKHCSNCNTVIVAQTIINRIAHNYGEWQKTKEPSCSKTGTERRDCLHCDNYEIRDIATLPHTEVIDKAIPATCSATGLTEGKHCSVCNTVIVAQITTNKIAHNYSDWQEVKPATCIETGTERRDCRNCEAFEIQSTSSLAPHTSVIDEAVAATCTETGLTEGSHCSVCGKVITAQYEVSKIFHAWVTDASIQPTCTETGLTSGSHCSVCGYISKAQEIIEARGHLELTDNAVLPTCTDTGLTAGKHCWRCNMILLEQSIVPATGHKKSTLMEADNPTCTSIGYTEWTYCSNCGITLSERQEIAALGHTEIIDKSINPTCENTGLSEGKHCTVCGAITVRQNVINALGHDWICSGYDNEKHTAYCTTCKENVVNEKHRWRDNDCSVCDYDAGGTKGLTYQLNATGTEYSLIRGKNLKDIIIPETYNELPVTAINGEAFAECNSIESIVLPFVGTSRGAVTGRASLFGSIFGATLNSSDTLQFWSKQYFDNGTKDYTYCKIPASLKTVTITKGGLYFGAFSNCNNIENIILGERVFVVEQYVFYGCSSLKNIEMRYVVGNLSNQAFGTYTTQPFGYAFGTRQFSGSISTKQLNNTYYIPQSLEGICITSGELPQQAFLGFSNLKSVSIENTVTTIGSRAFENCTSLSKLQIGVGILSVGNGAFASCTALTDVYISDIGAWCGITFNDSSTSNPLYYAENFYLNNVLITDLTIPNTVTEIKAGAFQSFSGTTIIIPSSVIRIELNAFLRCKNVTSVVFETTENWKAGSATISSIELSDSDTAIKYLTETYSSRVWVCESL